MSWSSRRWSRAIGAVAGLAVVAHFSHVVASVEFSTGPIASMTGAPPIGAVPEEHACFVCHYTKFGDYINTPGGALEILDLPETYQAGMTYDLRIRLRSDSTAAFPGRKWGFQLTAIRASDGAGSGTFIPPPGDSLQIVLGVNDYTSRSYIEHRSIATRTGLAGPVEWRMGWRAPDSPAGKVYFYAAGNAANGNQEPIGDFIFTTSDSMADATTPTTRMSLGELKSRYR